MQKKKNFNLDFLATDCAQQGVSGFTLRLRPNPAKRDFRYPSNVVKMAGHEYERG